MSYDTALAIFSPDGRLLQVERAQHASEQGALIVFSKKDDCITLALEKRNTSKMLIEDPQQKIFLIESKTNIYMTFCGLSADSQNIRKMAILICRQYKYDTGEDINILQLAIKLADVKQKNTISRGKRPFGIKTLLFGFFEGFRLFVIDPDGNYTEFKKGAIGAKSDVVMEYLQKNDCEEDCLEGICEVVNNDAKKINFFRIDKKCIERVDDSYVQDFVTKHANKCSK